MAHTSTGEVDIGIANRTYTSTAEEAVGTVEVRFATHLRGMQPYSWRIYRADIVDNIKYWTKGNVYWNDWAGIELKDMWVIAHRKVDGAIIGQVAYHQHLVELPFDDIYLVVHSGEGGEYSNKRQRV